MTDNIKDTCEYMNKKTQIQEYIKEQVQKGILSTGCKLPSVRLLAREFSCSVGTVMRAYEGLELEKIIYSVSKSGYYVLDSNRVINAYNKRDGLIDFSTSALDGRTLPLSDIQCCINNALELYKNELLMYSSPRGLPSFIQTLHEHLAEHQVFTHEDNIVVTTGSQLALHILCEMLFPSGNKKILVEQPCFYGMLKAVELTHSPRCGITRTSEGLDLEQVERIFKHERIKFFYLMPRFHNPLGSSLAQTDMEALIELAEEYNVYIVEDDIIGDLAISGKYGVPLFYYDRYDRVIYIKSFSKTVMPGLRIAVVVLPKKLVASFLLYKEYIDMLSPVLSQGALEIYLKNGMYEHHRRELYNIYSLRMQCLKNIYHQYYDLMDGIEWNIPDSGFYTCIRCLRGINYQMLSEKLLKKRIRVTNTNKYFFPEYMKNQHLRISISNVSEEEIYIGIPELLNILCS